jgi:tripeptide aminopeptidase
MEKLLNLFLRYVKIDTQSSESSETTPTTAKQKVLLEILYKELQDLGIEATYDKHSRVYGYLKGNTKKAKAIGFLAHIDTATEASGKDVKPVVIENYNGQDITLKNGLKIETSQFDFLPSLKGETIITTSGDTLLGADDKAGAAEIMYLLHYYKNNPKVERGDIYVAFTPDEEVGHGADFFDLSIFKADLAYTLDGGPVGGIEYETFNAAGAKVHFIGKSIHPGSAKDKMINSQEVAIEFHSMLPKHAKPQYTSGYDGFNHLTSIQGNVENTETHYIIRNHDKEIFNSQKKEFETIKDYLNKKYGYEVVKLEISDTYYNMAEILKDHMDIIELARKATINAKVKPYTLPVRGGTDGSRITFMGLPCPNIGTGGYNYHGPKELVSLTQMQKAVEILIELVKLVN